MTDDFDPERARKWLHEADYESLLRLWRFEPNGSPWFEGDIGRLFYKRFDTVRNRLSVNDMLIISKRVGFKDGRLNRGAFDQKTERH